MKRYVSSKEILLSALYLVMVVIGFFFLNKLLLWLFNDVIFDMLNWFNRKTFWFKIIIVVLGGGLLIGAILNLTASLSFGISALVFQFFPQNNFTVICAIVLGLVNFILCVIPLWKVMPAWDFWVVCEFIILVLFTWMINFIFIPTGKLSNTR